MSLTGENVFQMLKAAGAVGGQMMYYDEIAQAFNDAMLNYGGGAFNTKEKVAALISECMMESAYFRTSEEYSKNGRYKPYIGRSFIQVTWGYNYREFGEWCVAKGLLKDPDYFFDNPKKLADIKWVALGGVWYFTQKTFAGLPLTAYSSNIDQVGKAVNLGNPFASTRPNGWKAREAAYKAVLSVGADIVPVIQNEGFDMANSKNVYFDFASMQKLKLGENKLFYNAKKPTNVTVFSGETDGAHLHATVRIEDAAGNLVTEGYEFYWGLDAVKDGKPDQVWHRRRATTSDTAHFAGAIKGNPKDGRQLRLRPFLNTFVDGLVVRYIQTTGFIIEN